MAGSSSNASAPCVAVRRDDLVPVCHFCDVELHEVHLRRLRRSFGMGRGFIVFCPGCRRVIGSSAQWYPFPG